MHYSTVHIHTEFYEHVSLKSLSEPESEGRPETLSTTKLCKSGSIRLVSAVLLSLGDLQISRLCHEIF